MHCVFQCQQPLPFRDLTHEKSEPNINGEFIPLKIIKIMYLFILLVIYLLKSQLLFAHMLMKSPLPRGYKNNPSYPAIDYDLNGPLPSLVLNQP